MDKLTDKQEMFCREYLVDLNGKQAAIRCGYSEKTAENQASRLLSNVKVIEYLNTLKKKTTDKLELTTEMIVSEWMKLAFSSIADLHNTWITLKEFESLTPDQKAAIESIETKVLKKNIGTSLEPEIIDVEYVKIKLHSKTKALEELGKFKGIYKEDNDQRKQDVEINLTNVSTSDLEKLLKQYDKD